MASEIIYGRRPVYESLRAGRRAFRRVLIAEGSEDSEILRDIRSGAQAAGIRVEQARRDQLDAMAHGAHHQGVILEAGEYLYTTLPDVLDVATERGEPPFLLLLDLIQDVQNVGTLLRAAEAVGIHGVIIQERRAAGITPAVVNASSGAVEHLHVAQVTNLARAMEDLKQSDVWIAGLDLGDDAVRYDLASLSGGLGLVVGSEGKGLRRLVRETCDFIVYLPMRGQVASLNAATAGTVVLYAAWQAHAFKGER
jgi:23S rRNA (guanosine2251-2'-O)-methyltransferase